MTGVKVHFEDGDLLAQDAIRSIVRETYGGVRPTDRRVAVASWGGKSFSDRNALTDR